MNTWIGWHRPSPRSPWRAVITAGSEAGALMQLLDTIAGGDKTVLPSGVDPNQRPASMPRGRYCRERQR